MSDCMREDRAERKSEVGSPLKAAEFSQTPILPDILWVGTRGCGQKRLSPAGLSAWAQAVVAPSRVPPREMGKERLSPDCESL